MHLDWLDPHTLDQRDVDAVTALREAVRRVDRPEDLPTHARAVGAELRYGWDLDPGVPALARDAAGRVIGLLEVSTSRWDNHHAAHLDVTVDPSARRRGLGRHLFETGLDRARSQGRTLITAAGWEDTPAVAFAKAMGLDRASAAVRRAQDLWTLDWARLDELDAAAAARHAYYEIVPIDYPTPEGLLPAISELTAAINDAPVDDLDIEDEVFTPERLLGFEQAQMARDRRMYRLVARHRPSGDLAGHTVVTVEVQQPWHARQQDTSVRREHRGHRLGLALKIAMLRRLAAEEPQVRVLETFNAASNAHMIGVNEALGYRPVGRIVEWQRHLVPAGPA